MFGSSKAGVTDATKLKEVAEQRDYSGFVIDTRQGCAFFREKSRDEWLKDKKSNKSTKGMRLFVTPDPVTASVLRMRKCVPNEGMPLFRQPMLRGNLFINFTIKFPETISEDAAKVLSQVLPVPDPMTVPDPESDDHEHHYIEDMDPKKSEDQHKN